LNRIKSSIIRFTIICLVFFITPSAIAIAQDSQPDRPYYVVKEGDSLWSIAAHFGLSLDALTEANGISDPSQLTIGSQIVIPNLEGVKGELTTLRINFGDSLQGISRRYQIPIQTLAQLNHIVSPSELFAGYYLVVPVSEDDAFKTKRSCLEPGLSLFELAVSQGENPWQYVLENDLAGAWEAIPSEVLHIHSTDMSEENETNPPNALPESIKEIRINPTPFVQGKTSVIYLSVEENIELSGLLTDKTLNFFPDENGQMVSLQGVHAMTEPGVYTMVISGTLPTSNPTEKQTFSFSQTALTLIPFLTFYKPGRLQY